MGWASIQSQHAAHGVATYPLAASKTPAISNWQQVGARASRGLVIKFPDMVAAGFNAGARNRLTVIDVDSTDERFVRDMEARFGLSPLHVETPSGGRHLYYRFNGETRRIRPPGLGSVDILGAGNVVAAGSEVPKGRYRIIRGSLDDLDRLPRLSCDSSPPETRKQVHEGKRHDALIAYARSVRDHCDDFDQFVDVVRTWCESQFVVREIDAEIIRQCHSVWNWRGGRKRIMNHVVESPIWLMLIANPNTLALFAYLSAENGTTAQFMIADGLAEARGWSRRFVTEGRRSLLDIGIVECVRPPRKRSPGLYRWCLRAESK